MRTVGAALAMFLTLTGLAKCQTKFGIRKVQANADGSVVITWPVAPTWTYKVMCADALDGTWYDFPDGQVTAGSNEWSSCYVDTAAAMATQRFYKVRYSPAHLIMTLALDRSGSMSANGGSYYLAAAVSAFVNYFNDTRDDVAMCSFASNARLDVPIGHPFKAAVSSAVNALTFTGYTFTDGALQIAFSQEQSVPVTPGENILKVVVLFTDGMANTFQDTFTACPPAHTWNLTGSDTGNNVSILDTNTGQEVCIAINGGGFSCCPPLTQFNSIDGSVKSAIGPDAGFNVRTEGRLRALATANTIRNAGVTIYSIGFGYDADQPFLSQIANANTNNPSFNPDQPVGMAVIAPSVGDLQSVFVDIFTKIQVSVTP